MEIRRHLILITLIFASFIAATAQQNRVNASDTLSGGSPLYDSIVGFLPESLDADMHKLLEGWHVKHFSKPEDFCEDEDRDPYFPDSVYRLRLKKMPCIVPMTYNDVVRKCIDRYTGQLRNVVRYMMGMADFYFPMIEQKLDANHLPLELKYLAVVESALNPIAQSHVGACGLWQFMLPTGKVYGLEINSLIDERLDPEKATEAACRYFKEMYELYGDWHLVLAAYNCGPGNVNKAIRRAGGQTDFWKIFPYLPRETRSYVPLFIAAAYVMTYHCDHNICPVRADFSVATDTIMVERTLHFGQIADILHMDKEAIRFYNPQYKREIIPGNTRPSILRLPVDRTFAFIEKEDTLYAHRLDELLANCTPVNDNEPERRKEKITHTVQTGENVYTIANLYGVTAQNLRKWNGIKGSRIVKGRKLNLYVDNGGLTFATGNTAQATPPAAAKTQTAAATPSPSPSPAVRKNAADNSQGYISYTVKSGDSLYAIALRYPGVSVRNIQEANGLTDTKLRIGQILKIPKG
ncbi:MAG: LysM peptidoglycan-binding domain-containing protein [Tannerella sp.]|jgi:membrane-bound lytic murein transglycosylase D|nr:LysM peptidoglycan-binding domain-containing protein [Tannerella sp.]